MLRSMMLIINPLSGRGITRNSIGTVVSQLCDSGYSVTVYITGEYTAEQLVIEYAKRHELVVCVGGDGTLSSVVSGLLRSGVSIPLGYIPTGTANDIASTLSLSKDPPTAAKTIINGQIRPLDVGLFNEGRYFTYIAAFGAFTSVSYSTPQNAKRALGHFAYVLGGLTEVPAIKARRTIVEYDGGKTEGDFIFGGVVNSTSVAGFVKLDPKRVDLADGVFEIILVKQPVIPADFFDILAGMTMKTYDGDNVQLLHSSRARFTFLDEVAWTIDGEDGGLHKEVGIVNCPRTINIIVKDH